MKNEAGEILDDILSRWHQWQQGYRPSRGYNDRAVFAGQYRTSRQYDDVNGSLDDEIDISRMRAVDFQVSEMVDPYRAAIYCQARALAVGVAIFTSPRLPADHDERAKIVSEARRMLTERLLSAGVM